MLLLRTLNLSALLSEARLVAGARRSRATHQQAHLNSYSACRQQHRRIFARHRTGRQCPATSRLRSQWIAPAPANAPTRIVRISRNSPYPDGLVNTVSEVLDIGF